MAEIIIFLLAAAALLYGSDWVGNSSAKIAKNFSVSPVLIGITLLSIASSLPEISVALLSGIDKETDIGVGALLGSPIVNIGLILGLLLIFTQVDLKKTQFGRSIQILLLVLLSAFLLYFFSPSNHFSAAVLVSLGVIFLFLESVISKEDKSYLERIFSNISNLKNFFSNRSNHGDIFLLLAGIILMFFGARFLISSTISISAALNVSEILVATLLVALITSLPEGINAINSFRKGQPQLSAGNLISASILSLTFGLGIINMFGAAALDQSSFFLIIATTSLLALVTLLPTLLKIPSRVAGLSLVFGYLAFLLLFTVSEI